MIATLAAADLLTRFDPDTGLFEGAATTRRHLADLRGCFHDDAAYETALAAGDPLIYSVAAVEPGDGAGDLHLGLGVIAPGRIGDEYHLTKGHLHSWRDAAEFYIGLRGRGLMLLEDEATRETRVVPLEPNAAVYVPGRTAHRTVNIGDEPLAYLGVYPGRAGHDYGAIAERNFRAVLVERGGAPVVIDRAPL